MQASREEVRVEPGFDLAGALGLQAVVADASDRDAPYVGAIQRHGGRRGKHVRVERPWCPTRLPPRGPEPQRPEPAGAREERLLRDHPRAGELRVVRPTEPVAERRVVVVPERCGEEQPVVDGDALLGEFPQGHRWQRDVVDGRKHHTRKAASAGDLHASGCEHLIGHVLVELHPRRRVGGDVRRETERSRGGGIRRVGKGLRAILYRVALELRRAQGNDVGRRQHIVALVGDVVAPCAVHRQEAPRTEIERGPTREPLDALAGEHLGRLRRRQEAVPTVLKRSLGVLRVPSRCNGVKRISEQSTRQDALVVVVVLRQVDVARGVTGGDRQIHQPTDLVMQVRPQAGFLEVVRFVHAFLAFKVAGDVKCGDVAPPQRTHAVVLTHALTKRRVLHQRVEAVDLHDGARTSGHRRQAARRAVGALREVVRRVVRDVVERSPFGVGRPLRGSRASLLGAILDHAVGRVGSVEHGGRRTLDDLDGRDVLRVDVVDARRRLAPREVVEAAGLRGVVHPDPVQHDDRLVRERQAGGTADADARAAAGCAAALHHLHARDARIEEVGGVGRGRQLGDLGRIDRGHVVPQLALLLFLPRGRYDDHVERHRRGREREIERRRLPRGHRDRLRRRREPDESDLHLVRAGRHVGNAVPSLAAGAGLQARAHDEHRRSRDRLLIRLVRDLPGHGPLGGDGPGG